MKKQIVNYKDDFLDGSYTIYNYNTITTKKYIIYCQIAGFQKIGKSYYNELSNFPLYMVNFTTKGKGVFIVDNKEYEVEEGDLIFIQNSNHHILKPKDDSDWEFYFMHIYDNFIISEIYQDFFKNNGFILKNLPLDLKNEFHKIINLLRTKEDNYEAKISSLIYNFFLNVVYKNNNNTDLVDVAVSDVVAFINHNFYKPITLDDVLQHTKYSKNHLERLFKSKMNMTMQEYVCYLRIKRAQELLLTTNMLLKEVAENCGFSEYRSLHRLFKITLGCTPSEFRNSLKNGLKVSEDE